MRMRTSKAPQVYPMPVFHPYPIPGIGRHGLARTSGILPPITTETWFSDKRYSIPYESETFHIQLGDSRARAKQIQCMLGHTSHAQFSHDTMLDGFVGFQHHALFHRQTVLREQVFHRRANAGSFFTHDERFLCQTLQTDLGAHQFMVGVRDNDQRVRRERNRLQIHVHARHLTEYVQIIQVTVNTLQNGITVADLEAQFDVGIFLQNLPSATGAKYLAVVITATRRRPRFNPRKSSSMISRLDN